MAMIKFGQYVRIEVVSKDKAEKFTSDSLRIDFDIRNVSEFVRAKIDIYNLTSETAGAIMNGENYVSIITSLHGGEEVTIASNLYISNAVNETKLPNNITSLFCFSSVKKSFLEFQLKDVQVKNASLKNCIDAVVAKSKFEGNVLYRQFPEGWISKAPVKPVAKLEGSVQSCLRILGNEYKYNYYIDGDNLVLMHKVEPENESATTLNKDEPDVKLSTDNMRSNPKLGPATISLESNLDYYIRLLQIPSVPDSAQRF